MKYGAILADPPWYFRNFSVRGEGRNAVAHYDCMDLDPVATRQRPSRLPRRQEGLEL